MYSTDNNQTSNKVHGGNVYLYFCKRLFLLSIFALTRKINNKSFVIQNKNKYIWNNLNDNIMMNYKLLTIPLMLLCAACGKEKKVSELNETSVETVLPSETNEVTAIPLVSAPF